MCKNKNPNLLMTNKMLANNNSQNEKIKKAYDLIKNIRKNFQ